MSSVLGRFASPDPGNAGADVSNPQSWNGSAWGNPLANIDPSGTTITYPTDANENFSCFDDDPQPSDPNSDGGDVPTWNYSPTTGLFGI